MFLFLLKSSIAARSKTMASPFCTFFWTSFSMSFLVPRLKKCSTLGNLFSHFGDSHGFTWSVFCNNFLYTKFQDRLQNSIHNIFWNESFAIGRTFSWKYCMMDCTKSWCWVDKFMVVMLVRLVLNPYWNDFKGGGIKLLKLLASIMLGKFTPYMLPTSPTTEIARSAFEMRSKLSYIKFPFRLFSGLLCWKGSSNWDELGSFLICVWEMEVVFIYSCRLSSWISNLDPILEDAEADEDWGINDFLVLRLSNFLRLKFKLDFDFDFRSQDDDVHGMVEKPKMTWDCTQKWRNKNEIWFKANGILIVADKWTLDRDSSTNALTTTARMRC